MAEFKIPYGKQSIDEADIQAVIETLQADFLTQGPKIKEFEDKFAEYVGADYAVAVSNGTAALHLSALALEVNEKSKVITSPITFAASANCVRYCGGEVVFSDINSETLLLDVDKVRTLLEKSPKGTYQGIIPVDFAGYPVNLEAFRKLADEYNLWLIEDACHAPGAWFRDSQGKKQNAGNGIYADLAIFSFHPVKHIACGEGGMITTNRKDLYEKLLKLRTHGITKDKSSFQINDDRNGSWYHEMQDLGYNYRLTDIQAALGVSQLQKADKGLQRRQEIAQKYDKAFQNTSVKNTLYNHKNKKHAYHLYIIEVDNRKEVYDYLRKNGIFAQIHYLPAHLHPYYRNLGWKEGGFPISENYYQHCLSLPMYPTLTEEEQEFVIKICKECK